MGVTYVVIVVITTVSIYGTIAAECLIENATARCFCSKEIDILERVMLVELVSETCDCKIHILNDQDPPIITNILDRTCVWRCTNTTCGK